MHKMHARGRSLRPLCGNDQSMKRTSNMQHDSDEETEYGKGTLSAAKPCAAAVGGPDP